MITDHPDTVLDPTLPLAGTSSNVALAASVAAAHAKSVDAEGRFPTEALAEFRRQKLLAALVPNEHGGSGAKLAEVVEHCHAIAQGCASAAMVLAMHHIQVACVVAHGGDAPWQKGFLRRLTDEQLLLASVTSEAGIGGNIRTSACAVEPARNGRLAVEKRATAISYGEYAGALLLTARRTPDAAASDQVLVVLERDDYALEHTGGAWDALGMRGTCSSGFVVRASALPDQILAAPFSDIAMDTMLPVSHAVWAGVWTGIAASALERARAFVRADARNAKVGHPLGAARLAEAATLLHGVEGAVAAALRQIGEPGQSPAGVRNGRFVAEMNLLKLQVSDAANAVVRLCMGICGFAGYSNNTPYSLGRHLRDVQSAPLMVGNDRIREGTGNLMLMHRLSFGNFRR